MNENYEVCDGDISIMNYDKYIKKELIPFEKRHRSTEERINEIVVEF